MPCIKINIPLVFTYYETLCNDVHNNVAHIMSKYNFFWPKECDLKVIIILYDKLNVTSLLLHNMSLLNSLQKNR